MRILDIEPDKLCRKHLLVDHRELHAVWTMLTEGKKGHARNPETHRWAGKLKALYLRHQALVREMDKRRIIHRSDLQKKLATGNSEQDETIDSLQEQINILKKKKCACKV